MEHNTHSQRKTSPQARSIDGLVTSKPKQQPHTLVPPNSSPLPASPASMQNLAQNSSLARPNLPQPSQTKSLLNTAIPEVPPHLLIDDTSGTKKTRKKFTKKKVLLRSVLIILALFVGAGGWLGLKGLDTVNKVFHGNLISDVHALFSNTKLKGEDVGRINILLAGDSADDPNHGGAQLTDSIMVVSIDTKNHTGFMLSIPRDLWVNIPGWSHQKINAANDVTNFSQTGYPKGGMGQLEQIVQTQLGIPINYYALINYTAFKDAVNAVGGISVNIQSPDPRGLYDPNIAKVDHGPLLLKNGVQTLDGQTALNLARARGDPTYDGRVAYGFPQSDFNRTEHQRQMMLALEQKASSAGVLTNPIKISQLFSAMGNNVATDLKLPDVLRGVEITKDMNVSDLQSLTLSNSGSTPLLTSYATPNGQSALIPRAGIDSFGAIQQYYQKLTSDNAVVKESPSIIVLNASNTIGLARKEANELQAKGFNVVSVGDTNSQYSSTMVVDSSNTQKPASKQSLEQLLGTTAISDKTTSVEAHEAQGYTADFVVILGQRWATTH